MKPKYMYRGGRGDFRCWVVRFLNVDGTTLKRRNFTDNEYGGNAKAKAAGIKWRNWWAPRLGKTLDTMAHSSGTIGIQLVIKHPGTVKEYACFRAKWRETDDKGIRGRKTCDFRFDSENPKMKARVKKKAIQHRKNMKAIHDLEPTKRRGRAKNTNK